MANQTIEDKVCACLYLSGLQDPMVAADPESIADFIKVDADTVRSAMRKLHDRNVAKVLADGDGGKLTIEHASLLQPSSEYVQSRVEIFLKSMKQN